MKKVKVLFTALFASLFFIATLSASVSDPNPKNDLGTEIVKMLDHPNLSTYDSDRIIVKLLFMVNEEYELVLIETGTDNEVMDSYIKSKLNYKKIRNVEVDLLKFYSLKVKFKK